MVIVMDSASVGCQPCLARLDAGRASTTGRRRASEYHGHRKGSKQLHTPFTKGMCWPLRTAAAAAVSADSINQNLTNCQLSQLQPWLIASASTTVRRGGQLCEWLLRTSESFSSTLRCPRTPDNSVHRTGWLLVVVRAVPLAWAQHRRIPFLGDLEPGLQAVHAASGTCVIYTRV